MVTLLIILQVFVGQGFTSKGMNINAGAVIHNVDIQAAVDCPFFNNQIPGDFSFNAGYRVWMGRYSATPYIGITTEKKPIYSFEVGRDKETNGKIYLIGKYSNTFYCGVGLKAYIQ